METVEMAPVDHQQSWLDIRRRHIGALANLVLVPDVVQQGHVKAIRGQKATVGKNGNSTIAAVPAKENDDTSTESKDSKNSKDTNNDKTTSSSSSTTTTSTTTPPSPKKTPPSPPPPPPPPVVVVVLQTMTMTATTTMLTNPSAVPAIGGQIQPTASRTSLLQPTYTQASETIALFAPGATPIAGQNGRKGVDQPQSGMPATTVFTMAAATGTSLADPQHMNMDMDRDHHGGISETSEKVLVTAGTIGGLIVIGFVVWLLMRCTSLNEFLNFRRMKKEQQRLSLESNVSPGGFSVREEKPPNYSIRARSYGSQSSQSPIMNDMTPDAEFNQYEARRQAEYQYPNPARSVIGQNQSPIDRQDQFREPSLQRSMMVNNYMPEPLSVQKNAPTLRQPSVTQYRSNRQSELSSLSSGFGDAIDLPDAGAYRTLHSGSRNQAQYSARGTQGDSDSYLQDPNPQDTSTFRSNRDTFLTTTSEETSPPRFRTVQSWVGQQSRNVATRQDEMRDEIGSMPQFGNNAGMMGRENHQRNASEQTNPAFRAHPGDEVYVPKHERIPSAILDRNLGR